MAWTVSLLKMRTICQNVLSIPVSFNIETRTPGEKEAMKQYLEWVNPGTVLDLFHIIKRQDARIRGLERQLGRYSEKRIHMRWEDIEATKRLLRKKGKCHEGTQHI